jgi:Putative peptidoglycan binding domain
MRTSKACWFVMGMLCLVLWPAVSSAQGDWRIGQAQEQLKAAGFNPGPIDGVLGPRTRDALRRYQASQGLPATGGLDEATRRVLLPSERPPESSKAKTVSWLKAPPGGEYQTMASLYQLPDFFSGLGLLYIDPETLPVGPYLAYDRQGNLASTVYMLPLRDLRSNKPFNSLVTAPAEVHHVDIYYNNGHPGVPDPHYHVVFWHIPPEQAALLE